MAGSSTRSGTAVSAPLAIRNVVKAVNELTSLRADVIKAIPYNSDEIMKIPCLLIHLRPLRELHDVESENLGRYWMEGGFAFCEDRNVLNTCGAPFMRAILKKSLGSQGAASGRDWQFENLPQDHGLYHCFFDFEGLPVGCDLLSQRYSVYSGGLEVMSYLEGVEVDGRLMVVLSLKGYMPIWGYWGDAFESKWKLLHRARHFELAVNIVVFALTQEGSITHRLMESVR